MKTTEYTIKVRKNHHSALEALYVRETNELVKAGFGLKLWRALVPLERMAHKSAEDLCNIADYQDKHERIIAHVRKEVAKLFGGNCPSGLFVNSDPRGYALKLDPLNCDIPEGMEKDWGGYGILAAQID